MIVDDDGIHGLKHSWSRSRDRDSNHYHGPRNSDGGRPQFSSSDEDDSHYESPFQQRTCKLFFTTFGVQCAHISRSASAICIALLWSAAVSSLASAILSAGGVEDYEHASFWLSFAAVTILALGLMPCLSFKYVDSHSMWAVLLLLEVLGHLWGFRVKDLVSYLAYDLHHLANVYASSSSSGGEPPPTTSFCQLVDPQFSLFEVFSGTLYTSRDEGLGECRLVFVVLLLARPLEILKTHFRWMYKHTDKYVRAHE